MDTADNIENVVCLDYHRCAHCYNLLYGAECVRVERTYFCDMACAAEFDAEMDSELGDLEY